MMRQPSGQCDVNQTQHKSRFADECRQLTISLLKHDFELDVELPSNRLCPPVSEVCEMSVSSHD